MNDKSNLEKIAYYFAIILRDAIESGKIEDNARLIFSWDSENGIDGKITVYKDHDVEESDI